MSGPFLAAVIIGIVLCVLAFLGRDKGKPSKIPLLTFFCGLATIGTSVWSECGKVGDQTNIRRAIAPRVEHIINLASQQFSQMAIAAGELSLGSAEFPTLEQVNLVFGKLDPRDDSVVWSAQQGVPLSWLQFMEQYNLRTLMEIERVYKHMPFLDAELVRLLGELEDCYHFKEVQLTAAMPPANDDLTYAAIGFHRYQQKVRALSDYWGKNLKGFSRSTPATASGPVAPAKLE